MEMNSTTKQAEAPAGVGAGADELRARLHGMWSGVAEAWGAHAAFVTERGAAVSRRLLELSSPVAGERVLELACGAGGTGLEAAALVGPGGEIVQSDVAAEMVAIASERAAAGGSRNVHSRVLDLEQIEEPDGSFDVVLCREGLMLVPDPARATAEMQRVLRPGGRVAISVWGPRRLNPGSGSSSTSSASSSVRRCRRRARRTRSRSMTPIG
jgi:SAM-dependent methyltransferase